MSKKANPTVIGLFFAGGLALGMAGLLAFSSRSHFHPQIRYILYFNGSLKGLNPGAPVKFRGVNVGSVVEIFIRHNQASNDHSMPVVITVDKKLTQSKSDQTLQFNQTRLDQLISQGYRCRLDAESLVTGVLYVEFDLIPDPPPPVFHQLTPEYQEIPTVPSPVQQLLANLTKLDIAGLSARLNNVLVRADMALGQLDMADINAGVTNLLGSANRLVTSSDLTNAVASLRQALDKAGTLVKRIDGRVDPLADSATNTLYDAQKALADLRVALQSVSGLLGQDSSVPSDITQALQELSNASRAVANLAQFLERNPNTLLTGRRRLKELP
ncbi:MAG TPA: MlaD family protein [Patescibacteria group bacterium]|nr:MlaD family protein [Patescibacteria group bacterium]